MQARLLILLRKVWLLLVFGALGSFVVVNWDAFIELQAGLLLFPVSLTLAGVSQIAVFFLSAGLWMSLHRGLGLPRALRHFSMLNMGKYLPGKVWGMLARGTEMVLEGRRKQEILFATVTEQYLLVLGAAAVGAAGLGWWMAGPWAALILMPAVLLFGAMLRSMLIRILMRFVSLGESWQVPDAAGSEHHLVGGSLSIASWLANGIVLYLLASMLFPEVVSLSMLPLFVGAMAVAVSGGFLVLFAPAGFGVREGLLIMLLGPVIGVESAAFLSVSHRLWLLAFDLLLGGWILVSAGLHRDAHSAVR